MVICVNCSSKVIPVKNFWYIKLIPLSLFFLVFFPFALAYMLHFFAKSPRDCPVCEDDVYIVMHPPKDTEKLKNRREPRKSRGF